MRSSYRPWRVTLHRWLGRVNPPHNHTQQGKEGTQQNAGEVWRKQWWWWCGCGAILVVRTVSTAAWTLVGSSEIDAIEWKKGTQNSHITNVRTIHIPTATDDPMLWLFDRRFVSEEWEVYLWKQVIDHWAKSQCIGKKIRRGVVYVQLW